MALIHYYYYHWLAYLVGFISDNLVSEARQLSVDDCYCNLYESDTPK